MALRETAAHLRPKTKTESRPMPAMMFLISLLTPDVVEHYAIDMLEPAPVEQSSYVIDEMLARYDAEYEVDRALEIVDSVF